MAFRIADTFTDSLAKLTGDEQKGVKITAIDLQPEPVSPGMSFHKLDNVKDKNIWSVRVICSGYFLFIPQGHKFRTSRQAAQLSFISKLQVYT